MTYDLAGLFAGENAIDLTESCSSVNRSLLRSKTFPGLARAMAAQWGYGLYLQTSINF